MRPSGVGKLVAFYSLAVGLGELWTFWSRPAKPLWGAHLAGIVLGAIVNGFVGWAFAKSFAPKRTRKFIGCSDVVSVIDDHVGSCLDGCREVTSESGGSS